MNKIALKGNQRRKKNSLFHSSHLVKKLDLNVVIMTFTYVLIKKKKTQDTFKITFLTKLCKPSL